MSSLLKIPLRIIDTQEELGISEGLENEDACNAVADIIKAHTSFFPIKITEVFEEDPSVINTWPSIGVEWTNTDYTIVNLGGKSNGNGDGQCTYEANVGLNVWYYQNEVIDGANLKGVRRILSVIAKILLSHRRLNGLCAASEARIVRSATSFRPKENILFNSGFVQVIAPIRVCETNDGVKGKRTLTSIEC